MQVSEDTFELGKAIGQLLRGIHARGAKTLRASPVPCIKEDPR